MTASRTIFSLLTILIILASCEHRQKEETTPWGSEKTSDVYDLDDILESGSMIAVTLSGPDTYYDYRGTASGTQYQLCELFARHIGIPVRMEVCRDTAEMVRRIAEGSADLIACTIPTTADSAGVLTFCGTSIKERGQWAVNSRSSVLADSLDSWFRPSLIKKIEDEQLHRARRVMQRCKAQPQILDRRNGIISKYDGIFKRYAPSASLDWHLIAAQSYQESCFDPNAQSWAGACGLMQILPATAKELGLSKSRIFNPNENVRAGTKYMAQLINKFGDIASANERIKFALAAYNGGYHHVRDAMALAEADGKDGRLWSETSHYILLLAHPRYYNNRVVKYGYMRGSETVGYVNNIMHRWAQYKGIEERRAKKK